MPTEKESTTKWERPTNVLNEAALQGIWVDGIGFNVGPYYVVLEGIIHKPRSEKPIIATRIMFPTSVLASLVNQLSKALEAYKKSKLKDKKIN